MPASTIPYKPGRNDPPLKFAFALITLNHQVAVNEAVREKTSLTYSLARRGPCGPLQWPDGSRARGDAGWVRRCISSSTFEFRSSGL